MLRWLEEARAQVLSAIDAGQLTGASASRCKLVISSDSRSAAEDVVQEAFMRLHEHFEEVFDRIKKKHGVDLDTDVPTEGMKELCGEYKKVYRQHAGKEFPQDPLQQLALAIEAVFASWMTPRAVRYREVENIRGPTLDDVANKSKQAIGARDLHGR